MAVAEIATVHYRRRVALARRTATELARLWARVDRNSIGRSWLQLLGPAVAVLGTAQGVAAASSAVYVDDVATLLGLADPPIGRVQPSSFAGVASDGRNLAGLLYQPAITTLTALQRGETVQRSMASGRLVLDMIARTQVADAGRVADGVATVGRRQLTGYVRMLVGRSCSRCIALAGKRYRWNDGFLRHPRCDCVHVPSREDTGDDIRTDPRSYFNSLTPQEQDKAFTASGAQAIRDGADIAKVVNARRGAFGLATAGKRLNVSEVELFGRRLITTTEGGKGIRLMPESIYQIAGNDRDEAIRLLRRFGYIR